MREKFPNILSLYIDAEREIRMQRILTRQRDIDSGDLEKLFEKDNEYVLSSKDVEGVIVIPNNESKEELYSKIRNFFTNNQL